MDYRVEWVPPGGDFSDALGLRIEVFVAEQGFQEELDAIDPTAWHVVLYGEEDRPAATGRLFPKREEPGEAAAAGSYVIGRVAVAKAARTGGTGSRVMHLLEEKAAQLGAKRLELSAQQQAIPFYKKLGYAPYGEGYLDEYCPHIMMEKKL